MLSKEEIKQLESEGVTLKTNYFKSIDNRLFRKYGINLADYEDLLEEQGGVCLVCGTKPKNKKLSIDHCHNSLTVRGLLCNSCNLGLGDFKDNISSLKKAIWYLERFIDVSGGNSTHTE